MTMAQRKLKPKPGPYTEEDYYNLPETVRAELIEGHLIYREEEFDSPETDWEELTEGPDDEEDYYNLPENVRAELIKGHLIYNHAAPSRFHQTILMELAGTIREYLKAKGGSCRVFPAPFAVKLMEDQKSIVEPDISVICDRDKLTDRGCTGAPDWIIEIISPSTSSRDYVVKLNLYADAGVREYWIVDPNKESIFVYCLEEEHFKLESYTFRDKIKVNIYDDLYIDFNELDL